MGEDAVTVADVIRRAEPTADADVSSVLRYVADEGSRDDVPLAQWFRTLEATDGRVCLVCVNGDVVTFIRWGRDGLRELTRTADGRLLRPQPATRVRTRALVESADSLDLRLVEWTPFDRGSADG